MEQSDRSSRNWLSSFRAARRIRGRHCNLSKGTRIYLLACLHGPLRLLRTRCGIISTGHCLLPRGCDHACSCVDMRRGMSRTPPVHRGRRSETPTRRSTRCIRGMTPSSLSSRRVPSTQLSPGSTAPAEAWASPITAPTSAPAIASTATWPDSACQEVCALCQQAMPPDDHQGRNYLVWCFPCRCHMRMHLSCMLQMRMRCPSPACMHCRDPWPGDSADIALIQACQEANLPIVNSWEDLPVQGEHDPFAGMPPRPERVLVLCCASVGGGTMHAREMEWSPLRTFQVNSQGVRMRPGANRVARRMGVQHWRQDHIT